MATSKSKAPKGEATIDAVGINAVRWEKVVINREGPVDPVTGKKSRVPVGEGFVVYPLPLDDTDASMRDYIRALAPDNATFVTRYLRGNGVAVKCQAWGRDNGDNRSTTDDAAKAEILAGLLANGLATRGATAGKELNKGAKRAWEATYNATIAALASVKMKDDEKERIATETADKAAEAVMNRSK